MGSERERVARVAAAFAISDGRVAVGIGDDCAVLPNAPGDLVWTIDAAVEGTHFRRAWMTARDVGFRATMAAASDLAAMGAAPVALLSALVLPADFDDAALDELLAGQRAAADAIGAPIAGGNFARGGELSITTTALGRAARPILRSGARVGDGVWVAGALGLAGAGLHAVGRRLGGEALAGARAAFLRPRAQIAAGLAMAGFASAAIDVSDGTARDAGHVAEASGVSVVLDAAALLEPELVAAAAAVGGDALSLALSGGEDYALLAFFPRDVAPPAAFRRIGEIAPRGTASVLVRGVDGALTAPTDAGFDHFTTAEV